MSPVSSSRLNATSGGRTPRRTAPALGVQLRRAEERLHLARLEPGGERVHATRAEERRAAPAAEVGVPEHRDAQRADALPQQAGRVLGLCVAGLKADERHDVGRADARVHALVPAQVDPLRRNGDRRREPQDEVGGRPDAGEDRPVVVGVGVHVEHAGVRGQGAP